VYEIYQQNKHISKESASTPVQDFEWAGSENGFDFLKYHILPYVDATFGVSFLVDIMVRGICYSNNQVLISTTSIASSKLPRGDFFLPLPVYESLRIQYPDLDNFAYRACSFTGNQEGWMNQ
jgi:hypothetical protein